MDAVFELNRAKDFTGFRKAAAHFDVPSQNLIYADTKGNIGYQAPGQSRSAEGRGHLPGTGLGPEVPLDRLHPAKGPALRVQPPARLHRHRQPGRRRRGQIPLPAHQGLGLRRPQPADQRPHRVEDQGRRQGLHGRHADLPDGQQQRDRPAADALPDEDRHQGPVRPRGPAAAGGLGLHPGARLRRGRLLQRRLAQHPQARLRQQDAQGTAGRRPVPATSAPPTRPAPPTTSTSSSANAASGPRTPRSPTAATAGTRSSARSWTTRATPGGRPRTGPGAPATPTATSSSRTPCRKPASS